MTEQRHVELFEGFRAHRDALVRAAGDLMEKSAPLADVALSLSKMRLDAYAKTLGDASDCMSRIAHELAAGLERLTRLVDGVMDDTEVMDLGELAASPDPDEPP